MIDKAKEKGQGWNLEHSYLNLPHKFFSKMGASPVNEPEIIVLNQPLAKELGLDPNQLISKKGVDILSGNNFPQGAIPIAQAYSGHQFGHFTNLGDGRAVLIGEQRTPKNSLLDVQLKGGGPTPYSRAGDGRATVGPMLREYIISEAMNSLGIPTTRSLSVISTKDKVYREKPLNGAVLCRVAKSHIRVGTFEYASKYGNNTDIRALADYSIKRHYKECINNENPYLDFLIKVINKQAILTAKWMLVGFVHGVMNTDNMSIAGETIDYGPCAFMDAYNLSTVFSSIDSQGRYAYGNQPHIAQWNLAVFAETILPLISDNPDDAIALAKSALASFGSTYYNEWFSGIKAKLGFLGNEIEDESIINDLLEILKKNNVDYTYFFAVLTIGKGKAIDFFETSEYKEWQIKWERRVSKQDSGKEGAKNLMKKVNPWMIARNQEVERVLSIAVEEENYKPFYELVEILLNPFDYSKLDMEYYKPAEATANKYKTYCGT